MREINIGAGTLSRPIENIVATLLHEMCHYWNDRNGIKDCSRGGTYHNKKFRDTAEACGLIVSCHPTYGWAVTSPSDDLLLFCIENELTDIKITRNDFSVFVPVGGASAGTAVPKKSSSRKYICPCCGMSIRATRDVNIACLDCDEQMMLAG